MIAPVACPPTCAAPSSSTTRRPSRAASIAAEAPAAPEPTMQTSQSSAAFASRGRRRTTTELSAGTFAISRGLASDHLAAARAVDDLVDGDEVGDRDLSGRRRRLADGEGESRPEQTAD